MTRGQVLNRPHQTPAQREDAERVIAAMKMSRGQPSAPTAAEQESAWEAEGRAGRDAELRARGLEPSAEPNSKAGMSLSREPQTEAEKWEAEGRAYRDEQLRARGMLPAEPALKLDSGRIDYFAPVDSVEMQHKTAPPEISDIRALADKYHAAFDEVEKLEANPVPNTADTEKHRRDPKYEAYEIQVIAANQKLQQARSALVEACRLADHYGRPYPPEYRPGARLHPDTIEMERRTRKEAEASKKEQLRARGIKD